MCLYLVGKRRTNEEDRRNTNLALDMIRLDAHYANRAKLEQEIQQREIINPNLVMGTRYVNSYLGGQTLPLPQDKLYRADTEELNREYTADFSRAMSGHSANMLSLGHQKSHSVGMLQSSDAPPPHKGPHRRTRTAVDKQLTARARQFASQIPTNDDIVNRQSIASSMFSQQADTFRHQGAGTFYKQESMYSRTNTMRSETTVTSDSSDVSSDSSKAGHRLTRRQFQNGNYAAASTIHPMDTQFTQPNASTAAVRQAPGIRGAGPPSDDGRTFAEQNASNLSVGQKVQIREKFFSNDAKRTELSVGLTGTIKRFNKDGHALIEFLMQRRGKLAKPTKKWVFKSNFARLRPLVDTRNVGYAQAVGSAVDQNKLARFSVTSTSPSNVSRMSANYPVAPGQRQSAFMPGATSLLPPAVESPGSGASVYGEEVPPMPSFPPTPVDGNYAQWVPQDNSDLTRSHRPYSTAIHGLPNNYSQPVPLPSNYPPPPPPWHTQSNKVVNAPLPAHYPPPPTGKHRRVTTQQVTSDIVRKAKENSPRDNTQPRNTVLNGIELRERLNRSSTFEHATQEWPPRNFPRQQSNQTVMLKPTASETTASTGKPPIPRLTTAEHMEMAVEAASPPKVPHPLASVPAPHQLDETDSVQADLLETDSSEETSDGEYVSGRPSASQRAVSTVADTQVADTWIMELNERSMTALSDHDFQHRLTRTEGSLAMGLVGNMSTNNSARMSLAPRRMIRQLSRETTDEPPTNNSSNTQERQLQNELSTLDRGQPAPSSARPRQPPQRATQREPPPSNETSKPERQAHPAGFPGDAPASSLSQADPSGQALKDADIATELLFGDGDVSVETSDSELLDDSESDSSYEQPPTYQQPDQGLQNTHKRNKTKNLE